MKLGTCCYQRPWKTCRTSWSHSPPTAHSPLSLLHHPVSPHLQSSCEKQFEQKVSLNLRSRRRHRCLTHRIPPPSATPHPLRGKAISYPQSGHFSVSLQPFLLLLLFYSALISKVALRVPKIISNGITLNEMQSTSSTNNKQQQLQQQQQEQQQEQQKKGQMIIKRGRADVEAVPGTEAEVIASEGTGRKDRDRDRRPRTGGNRGCCDECLTPDRQQSQKLLINSP